MKITFLGAAHEVTGSCTYIEVGDKKGIVDYGMQQGKDIYVNEDLPVAPSELDFALLTHAHIDHSGLLPLMFKNGFAGSVYTSEATAVLMNIMLNDSANIQMSSAEYENRKGKRSGAEPVEPLYDTDDVAGLMKLVHPCPYGKIIEINDCVSIRLTDVGHLLGSAAIEVFLTEGDESRSICFSGDLGNINQPILKDPEYVRSADYVVIESTYGDRNHELVDTDYVTELASRIEKVLGRGGNIVIPSFAVGRTQEMLYFIRQIKEDKLAKGVGNFPVYLDSPLATEATSVFLQCDTDYVDDEMRALIRSGVNPLVFPNLKFTQSQQDSQAINNDPEPKVIIAASGMCEGGRIRHHLKHNLWRADCMILFVGYQSVGTLGRIIVDGIKKVKLFGEEILVNAEIDTLPGVSGHADKDGLISWITAFEKKPSMVFVNHGDPESAESFKACLNDELGFNAFAPYSGTQFDLLSGEFVKITEGIPVSGTDTKAAKKKKRAETAFDELVRAAEQLLEKCKNSEGLSNKILHSATEDIKRIMHKL